MFIGYTFYIFWDLTVESNGNTFILNIVKIVTIII